MPPRRPLRAEHGEATEDSSDGRDSQRKGHRRQRFDSLVTNMNQPHFVLNLLSIVFFCVACLLLLLSTHQQGIKLIMPDCRTETTITQNTNKFVSGGPGFFGDEKGELGRSGSFSVAGGRIPIELGGAGRPGGQSVEFVVAGNSVPVAEAMDLEAAYDPVEHVDYGEIERSEREDADGESGVKFFVAITSTCCTQKSREMREAIRRTWMGSALEAFDSVDVKFFLAQPDRRSAEASASLLRDELARHGDIVVVRGRDLYENLPNKTFGILKYALSSPRRYTHVLKTDEDCYVRVHKLVDILNPPEGPQMENMYKGCMENRGGFFPIRDPKSKWYLRYDELDDYTAQPIRGTKYLAGWGYIVTRDVALHAMKKVYAWDNKLENVPLWYPVMKWEDVLMGILVSDKVSYPDSDFHFKAAWRACTNETAIRHLDLDAPGLMRGLHEQEISGLWDKKTVQCSTGSYVAGDYSGWKRWRNSVTADTI